MKTNISRSRQALLAVTIVVLTTAGAALSQERVGEVKSLAKLSQALQVATDLGPVSGAQPMSLTVRLAAENGKLLDSAIAELYDPSSPKYHEWMTDAQLKQFAPTEQQVQTVRTTLEKEGLTVTAADPNGFWLRVSGSASNVQSAFHTSLHQFQYSGKVFRANTTPAYLDGEANKYVSSISGLESHTVHPMLKRALNIRTKQAPKAVRASTSALSFPWSSYITEDALAPPTTYTFTTPGAPLPVGVFYGNQYDHNEALVVDFLPSQLQAVYGLPAAYAAGLNGAGQTVVLLEAYGDSYMESDANLFSSITGLPALNSSTFSVVYPEGKNPNADTIAALLGWDTEIALDIQWAHAMAPAAKIVVVVSNGQDAEDFQYCMSYIVAHATGYTVSDSWETDLDLIAGPVEQQSYEDVLKLAAAKGISFQFSTGDSGDEGLGEPVGAAGVPSDAPHATAVGGTTILDKLTGSPGFEPVGWGNVLTLLDDDGVLDPPAQLGFIGGSGGGESLYFAKPSWQASLPGTGRQTPDVSALADPYTGVPIVLSVDGVPEIQFGWGGTSLASPVFTAIWALAQQKAGGPLGQAAPLVASLPSSEIQDVLPLTSPTDTAGSIFDDSGVKFYSPADLFSQWLYGTTDFISAVWNLSSPGFPFYYDLGFGMDTSLTVTPGWDNVTGYGTPNGLPFINGIASKSKKK